MVCIRCGGQTAVSNSRPQKRLNQVWRRRECLACGTVFTSLEAVDQAGALRVRSQNKHLKPLSRDKLFLSLYKSLAHRPSAIADAGGLTATILAKVAPTASGGIIETDTIVQTALVALNRFDRVGATHYRAFHHP